MPEKVTLKLKGLGWVEPPLPTQDDTWGKMEPAEDSSEETAGSSSGTSGGHGFAGGARPSSASPRLLRLPPPSRHQ